MRTEQQMMELILGYAQKDDRVRAVAMNGSRVNPGLPADRFQEDVYKRQVDEKTSLAILGAAQLSAASQPSCSHPFVKSFRPIPPACFFIISHTASLLKRCLLYTSRCV